jgi:hypothetical protein
MAKLVAGVGINDANYDVTLNENVDGKRKVVWVCPFYNKWQSMLVRCYSGKYHEKQPTYIGCSVCEEWHTFSNFRAWMEQHDWENKHLDKDLLKVGNKEYNPDNCVFVPQIVNTFLTDSANSRGEYPIGVHFDKLAKKFRTRCCNPFTGKQEHLGVYECPSQAHLAWKRRKHELACQLADSEHVTDERVAQALRTRYL